nr:MAG TPA: hypothetical protein [Caudoviricetes sp.]
MGNYFISRVNIHFNCYLLVQLKNLYLRCIYVIKL